MIQAELLIRQDKSEKYSPRTYYNAKHGDITVALAVDLDTYGEKLTHKAAGDKYIGFKLTDDSLTIDIARELYKKLKANNAKTLNIAGNGIYTLTKYGCGQKFINQFTYESISQVHKFYPLERIYTGGQTGVDIAGAIAGYALQIPTEVTLPFGFKQRFENGKDINQTESDIFKQIEDGAFALELYTPILTKNKKP